MSDQDPVYQETTRVTVTETDPLRPAGPAHVESAETTVRARESKTPWWIAGAVALAAIIGIVWMVLSANGRDETVLAEQAEALAVQGAIDNARLQGQIDGAQEGLAVASAASAAADRAAAEAAAARAQASRPPEVVVVSPEAPAPDPAPAPAGEPPVQ